MCQSDDKNSSSDSTRTASGGSHHFEIQQKSDTEIHRMEAMQSNPSALTVTQQPSLRRRRRGKRDKDVPTTSKTTTTAQVRRKQPPPHHRHDLHKKDNATSSAVVAILPSLAGVVVLGFVLAGRSGFRGRPSVCGVDLGTTNSVICVRHQNGTVQCIPDGDDGSVIVPSVVSFLEPHERPVGPSTKVPSPLIPHPSQTIVGTSAKKRIDSHPHHTVYNAKRILGKQFHDPSVQALAAEVEFAIFDHEEEKQEPQETPPVRWATIRVPDDQHGHYHFRPHEIGGYVLTHLRNMVARHLGHDNVRSAVICVPAKFTPAQRQHTVNAYQMAGFHVVRIIEEPTAAALAYGLHRKPDVDYILVYDFGGGTLDVSLLHVSEGFVDVLGVDGDDRLGGADFDSAISRYFVQQHDSKRILEHVSTGLRSIHLDVTDEDDILAAQCPKIQEPPLCTLSSFHTIGERIKIKLSENYYAHEHEDDFSVAAECWGLEESSLSSFQDLSGFCSALTLQTLSLTRLQFANLAQPLFDRSLAPVKQLLRDLEVDDVDEIVMVGGTTRMPQIRSLVAQQFPGKPLNVHIDPDITVAYGAASVVD